MSGLRRRETDVALCREGVYRATRTPRWEWPFRITKVHLWLYAFDLNGLSVNRQNAQRRARERSKILLKVLLRERSHRSNK